MFLIQSVRVGDTVYESLWYDRSKRYKKLIPMFLLRAQNPIYIKVGPIWMVSFGFCTEVCIK